LTNYVVCLKYGDKYSATYVNRLYNMVCRNLTVDYKFVCFTDNSAGIDPGIETQPLPKIAVQGWWFKPMFFNPELGLDGTVLFLDLDLVIFRNIDNLFSYKPGKFLIIRDFNRTIIKDYPKFNSSVFRLDTGNQSQVYSEFIKDPRGVSRRFLGDQDWIYSTVTKDFDYWPVEWIQSYKWECRRRAAICKRQPAGERDFKKSGKPTILEDTSIAVFHGDPNPHNCKDPWVKENWR